MQSKLHLLWKEISGEIKLLFATLKTVLHVRKLKAIINVFKDKDYI